MILALKLVGAFIAFAIVVSAPIWLPVLFEWAFHPRERQRRRHQGKDWHYAIVDLPHVNADGTFEATMKRQVKYRDDEYYLRNRKPQCHGRRWEPNWIEVESDSTKETIKDQI